MPDPVRMALDLLRSGSGAPLDLMREEGECVMSTLGLVLEDDLVTYIIPAGPAQLAGSVQIGDKVVAVDNEAVSKDTILECISENERVGNVCTLTLERLDPSMGRVQTVVVKLPRSSRLAVSQAEHMVGLLEEHRRILDLTFDDERVSDLHKSLDTIVTHLFERENKRMQRVFPPHSSAKYSHTNAESLLSGDAGGSINRLIAE